ncbi:hypothetical protein JZO78_04230 [Enterococcus ureilyticus]|uniref:hypothetical protein n=1 Tax=Enterococcus ureilyticus TaxID=1131292 RepID=UPI001A92F4D6|nr:hypothetical protein [Enterococcus ureilyticus]MBO0445542.1 hypothetical protein [Enterococcus ureilyticus]
MEEVVYLDELFEFLEANGVDTSIIKVVDYDIDIDYVMEDDCSLDNARIFRNFLENAKKKTDNPQRWVAGFLFVNFID